MDDLCQSVGDLKEIMSDTGLAIDLVDNFRKSTMQSLWF